MFISSFRSRTLLQTILSYFRYHSNSVPFVREYLQECVLRLTTLRPLSYSFLFFLSLHTTLLLSYYPPSLRIISAWPAVHGYPRLLSPIQDHSGGRNCPHTESIGPRSRAEADSEPEQVTTSWQQLAASLVLFFFFLIFYLSFIIIILL